MNTKKGIRCKVKDAYTQQRLPLLDFGKDINVPDRRGETQLHKELKAGIFRSQRSKYSFETTKLLLEHGADMNICGRDGITPLQEAFLSGIPDAVEVFVPKEDQLLNSSNLKSIIRCRYLINFFLDQGQDLNIADTNYSPLLHFAALNGDNESFSLILEKSQSNLNAFNSKGTTLLHIAALHEKQQMIELLASHGADLNLQIQPDLAQQNIADRIRGFTPLHLAVSKGHLSIVETLVRKGADVNASSPYGSPLHVACETFYISSDKKARRIRNTKIAKLLINNGADIEALSTDKKTPLQKSCDNKYEEMVQVLLQQGANFRMKLLKRRSVLHYIIGINNFRIMKLFLDRGLDPNVRDLREETPLIYGSKSSVKGISMDIIELLVEYGADINARDINGMTALHIAASLYDLKAVKNLLRLGANVNALTNNELTPLDRVLIKFRGKTIQREHTCFKTVECLCAHTVLSQSRGEENVNLNMIKGQPVVNEFYQECQEQIAFLKTEQICTTSSICYYDLLNVEIRKLTLLLRNDDLIDQLVSKRYWEIRVYGNLLKDRVEQGKVRRDLIEKNSQFLKKITKKQLPYFVNDMIFNCLSLRDLRSFEQACNFSKN